MPSFLVPQQGGKPIPLDKAILLFGRQHDCDVTVMNSRKVSRKHCCIAQVNDYYVVRDLASMNGVRVNGRRVKREARLKVGDELIVGDVAFRLQQGGAGGPIVASAKGKQAVKPSPPAPTPPIPDPIPDPEPVPPPPEPEPQPGPIPEGSLETPESIPILEDEDDGELDLSGDQPVAIDSEQFPLLRREEGGSSSDEDLLKLSDDDEDVIELSDEDFEED